MYIKGHVSICVNAHCLMLEVLRYIALNALNTVQKIKAMLKMSKIDKVHLRAVMLCMSKMSKIDQIHLRAVMLCMSKMSKIDQIHLRAVMLCMSKMSKMGKEHTHTFWLITSLILNGFSIQKKFWKAETSNISSLRYLYVSLHLRMQNAVPAQPCVGKIRISLVLLNFLHCNFRLWFETP